MKVLRPLKAIRAKCLDCCAGQALEVRLCPIEKCPLYAYRLGHRPKADKDTAIDEFVEKSSPTCGFFGNAGASDGDDDEV